MNWLHELSVVQLVMIGCALVLGTVWYWDVTSDESIKRRAEERRVAKVFKPLLNRVDGKGKRK